MDILININRYEWSIISLINKYILYARKFRGPTAPLFLAPVVGLGWPPAGGPSAHKLQPQKKTPIQPHLQLKHINEMIPQTLQNPKSDNF